MALNLMISVVNYLENHPEEKFTAQDIANWIFQTNPDECREKQKRSKAKVIRHGSAKALINQIASEISSKHAELLEKNPKIKTIGWRPRKYYYTDLTAEEEVKAAEDSTSISATTSDTPPIKEHDLYPILTNFLWSELNIYSKRIDEKRASNSHGAKGNRWLYPDLVGMEVLSQDWKRAVEDCVREYADKKTKLWSFEVKVLINRSNIREAFFQTVSNSSWANFGYLVANEIEGISTLKELRILAGLHGIGFIELNKENPSESQIIIPAKERNKIDWNTINRLATENKDFLAYIELIRKFYQTDDPHKTDWDTQSPED